MGEWQDRWAHTFKSAVSEMVWRALLFNPQSSSPRGPT